MKGINLLSVNYSGQYYNKTTSMFFSLSCRVSHPPATKFHHTIMLWYYLLYHFHLDGNFTDLAEELSNTCNDGEYNVAVGGSNNCTAGKVEDKRQCKHRPCLGLDGTIYYPDEFEIVYRNCTLKEFCPSFPPRKKTKLTEILKLHKKHIFGNFFKNNCKRFLLQIWDWLEELKFWRMVVL